MLSDPIMFLIFGKVCIQLLRGNIAGSNQTSGHGYIQFSKLFKNQNKHKICAEVAWVE